MAGALAEAEARVAEAEALAAKWEAKFEAVNEAFRKEAREKSDSGLAMETQVGKLKTKLASMEAVMASKDDALARVMTSQADMMDKLSSREAELAQLKGRKMGVPESKVKALQDKLTRTSSQLATLQKNQSVMLAEKDRQLGKLKKELQRARSESSIDKSSSSISPPVKEIIKEVRVKVPVPDPAQEERIQELESQLKHMESVLAVKTAKIKALEEDVGLLMDDIEGLEERAERAEADWLDAEDRLESLVRGG